MRLASGDKWIFHADVHSADGSLNDVFSKSLQKRVLSMRLYGDTTFHCIGVPVEALQRYNFHRGWPQE